MTLADVVIVLVLILFAISGLKRGVIWELLTTIGLVASFGLLYYFRAEILELVIRITRPGWERQWGGMLIFLLFFVVVYIGFALLGRHLHNLIKNPVLKFLDHGLGLVAGIVKGAILIALLVAVIQWTDTGGGRLGKFVWESKIIRWGKELVHNVIRWESPENRKWVEESATGLYSDRLDV
ncbi:CvpA family protein [bacterium]|nr:CvpA family protein [bacterium]MBU1984929.1 CvpA family protein [bacterium]